MPKKTKKAVTEDTSTDQPRRLFRMDTEVFQSIWIENLKAGKGWQSFCVALFDRFTRITEPNGQSNIDDLDAEFGKGAYKKWDKPKMYKFMNDRAYQKCTTMKKRIEASAAAAGDTDFRVSFPDGWDTRNGEPNTWTPKKGYEAFGKVSK